MPRYLALEADATGFTVATANVRSGAIKLEKVFAFADNPQPLTVSTAPSLGFKLKELLKQAGIAPAPVLVAIGRDRIFIKDVKYPPTAPQDEPAIVRFQAIKELTESPDEMILDYTPVTIAADPAGEQRALVAFLKKDHLHAIKLLCEAAGLKLAGVSPRPFAATSATAHAAATGAVPAIDTATASTATVTLGESNGEFTVVRNGNIRFSRSIPAHVMGREAPLIAELRRNLTLAAAQNGDDIQAIYLAEAEVGAGAWAARLADSLPIPVHAYDPLAGSDFAGAIPPRSRGRFAGVVGLLTAKAGHGSKGLNFLQPRQPRATVNPKRNRTAALVLVGLALLAGLGFGGFVMVQQAKARTQAMREKVEAADAELKTMEVDLKRLAAVDEFDSRQVVWLDELYDLADRYPDINKMKMMSFVGDMLPPPTQRERQQQLQQPPNKNAPPKPVATVRFTVATDNGKLADTLVDGLAGESKYYVGAKKSTGGLLSVTGTRSALQLYTIETKIAHRNSNEYTRKIRATIPKAPEPVPAKNPAAPANDIPDAAPGFGGGFGNFDGGPLP